MRCVLIIETSTEMASLALVFDGEVVLEKRFVSGRRHNALLFEPLAEIIAAKGERELEAVLVGSGPASYSGTRVGIATAQGAALVSGCQAISIPSILATPEALSGKPCLAVGDARRGNYWFAHIENGQLIQAPTLTDTDMFERVISLAEQKGSTIFAIDPIKGREEIDHTFPSAARLWQAWQISPASTQAAWSAQIPQPIYLAPPHITPSKKTSYGLA
jgi:tRNA threonylcarbamoyladenosine biosynthesis protein TsaB